MIKVTKRLLRKKIICLIIVLIFCISIVNAAKLLTKIEFEITGLTGITQLDNSDGKSVNVTIMNSSNDIVVTRNAAAGIYKENMTILMIGDNFNLSYSANHTYNLSTTYGDFLYNFTTPKRRMKLRTGANSSFYTGDDADIYGTNKSFVNNSDGTVTDEDTGLMWIHMDSNKTLNWSQALDYCDSNTTAGYTDWRLPTVLELGTMFDHGCDSAAGGRCYDSCQNNAFTWSTTTSSYFSSTPVPSLPARVYIMGVTYCRSTNQWTYNTYYVRCVRDE